VVLILTIPKMYQVSIAAGNCSLATCKKENVEEDVERWAEDDDPWMLLLSLFRVKTRRFLVLVVGGRTPLALPERAPILGDFE